MTVGAHTFPHTPAASLKSTSSVLLLGNATMLMDPENFFFSSLIDGFSRNQDNLSRMDSLNCGRCHIRMSSSPSPLSALIEMMTLSAALITTMVSRQLHYI